MRRFLAALVIALVPCAARAAGLEIQGYPAGGIVAASHALRARGPVSLTILAGWNFTDRRDWGEHDDEHGGGPGLGLAAWRWLGADRTGWGVGARADVWRLEIDWEEDGRRGSSKIVVLQPTARAGHAWRVRGGAARIEASVSLGAEVNVRTHGEDVGDGAILLVGIGVSR